jgi:hypothetical protein
MAQRALAVETLIPVAERMRDRMGLPSWRHAVEQGRMFSRTYLALAHGGSGGVADSLRSRRERWKFYSDARDWRKETRRALDALRMQDPDWYEQWSDRGDT